MVFIKRGPINFDVFEDSIRVTSKFGTVTIKEPFDIDSLCKLIEMGAELQAAKLRDIVVIF